MEIPADFNWDSCAERVLRRIACNSGAQDATLLLVDSLPFQPALATGEDAASVERRINMAQAYRNAFLVKTMHPVPPTQTGDDARAAQRRHRKTIDCLRQMAQPLFSTDYLLACVPDVEDGAGSFTPQQCLPPEAWGLRESDLASRGNTTYRFDGAFWYTFSLFFFGRRGTACR